MRECRVQVDRHVERLRALEDHPILFFVEEAPLSMAVDHRALEAELLHGTLELLRSGVGVGSGKRGERGEAVGVRAHRFVRAVVGVARHRDRHVRPEALRPRRAEREHLDADSRGVHVREALCTEVGVLLDDVVADLLAARAEIEIPELVRGDLFAVHRGDEMFFDGDGFHGTEPVGRRWHGRAEAYTMAARPAGVLHAPGSMTIAWFGGWS